MVETNYKRVNSLSIGESLTRPVFIDSLEEARKDGGKGDPYVRFRISDSSCSIQANMFQCRDGRPVTIELLATNGITAEMMVMMTIEKNEKGYINVKGIGPNTDKDVTLHDFAQKSEGSADERFNNIIEILENVSKERKFLYGEEGKTIAELAIDLYHENEEALKWSSAAEIMHSEKAGGLMEHTEAMVRNAVKVCEVYPDLDKELLVTATALHDIGKIEELFTSPIGRASYTPQGIALGHIVLGYSFVDRHIQKNPDVYPNERVLLLESLILSHQGIKEHGSPIEPIVKEAFMLFHIDEMDAKYQEMKKAVASLKPGEISQNSPLGIKHRIYNPIGEE